MTEEKIARSEEPQVDYIKYGALAETVRDLHQNPDAIHKLILSKRKANDEAKQYREMIETDCIRRGIEPADFVRGVELYNMAERGQLYIDDLSEEDRELAEVLVLDGSIDAEDIGMDESYFNELQTAMEEAFGLTDDGGDGDPDKEPALDPEVEAIRTENARLKLVQKLIADGANPKAAEKLAKLWEEPTMPEEFKGKDGNPLDEAAIAKEKQRIMDEHMKAFKTENSWGFIQGAAPQAPPTTHNAPAVPPVTGALTDEYLQAKARGDVAAMLKLRNQTEIQQEA